MPAPTPYLHLPGTAREALTSYAQVFGGTAELHTFAEFGRTDGPSGAVAHGLLTGGPVAVGAVAGLVRRVQNGYVRSYALSVLGGALVVVLALLAVNLA